MAKWNSQDKPGFAPSGQSESSTKAGSYCSSGTLFRKIVGNHVGSPVGSHTVANPTVRNSYREPFEMLGNNLSIEATKRWQKACRTTIARYRKPDIMQKIIFVSHGDALLMQFQLGCLD